MKKLLVFSALLFCLSAAAQRNPEFNPIGKSFEEVSEVLSKNWNIMKTDPPFSMELTSASGDFLRLHFYGKGPGIDSLNFFCCMISGYYTNEIPAGVRFLIDNGWKMLASDVLTKDNSVILVDKMDNGIYYISEYRN